MSHSDLVGAGVVRETRTGAAALHHVDLLDAMVAACALMAHADGEVAGVERRRLYAVLRAVPALAGLSQATLVERVAEQEANFRLDPELAQELAREKLVCIVGQPKAASLILAACRQILRADGIAHPSEYRALLEINALLGCDDER